MRPDLPCHLCSLERLVGTSSHEHPLPLYYSARVDYDLVIAEFTTTVRGPFPVTTRQKSEAQEIFVPSIDISAYLGCVVWQNTTSWYVFVLVFGV